MAIPTIDNNFLGIQEGNTIPLTLNNLNATAEGATNAEILITIVPDSETSLAGEFLLNGEPTLSFTLFEVETGQVEFAHDDSNFTPSYSVIASNDGDASEPQQAIVEFDATNNIPTIETNPLAITEGGTVVLNLDTVNLLATDQPGESTPDELTYEIKAATNGTFQRLADGGTVDLGVSDTFTQADVDSNLIQFVHDGDEAAPTIGLRLTDSALPDGGFNSLPNARNVAVEVAFSSINDAPEITTNTITLSEGDTVPITVDNLAATDVEDDDATLTFTVTAIAEGRFELLDAPGGNVVQVLAAPGQDPVSFTQADVTAGLIQFANDPGTETTPSYTIEVSDSGRLTATDEPNAELIETSDPSEAEVDYTSLNDTPIVVVPDSENPTLIDLPEQTQFTFTAADLFVKDEESTASNLTYTVTDLDDTPAGQFVRLDPDGGDSTPTTFFTQAAIDAEEIAFDYFGVAEAPSFLLTVTDEEGADVEISSDEIFNFLPENTAPELGNLVLTVNEGETVPITSDNLLYTDAESAASELTYTVTINNIDPENPQETDDRFIIDGAVEVGPVITFTQQQINDGVVSFVHGGSNDAPDLTVTLTDTAVGGDANTIDVPLSDFITFIDENDPPLLETFAFTLNEGDTVELTSDVLSVTDEEAAAADITYTVDAVTGGNFFRLPIDPGGSTPAESFTQAEIDAGNVIVFEHDGLNDAPTFTLTVSDGTNEIQVTDQSGSGISYTPTNDEPIVVVSSFTVPEGDPDNPVPFTLTSDNLLVEDEAGESPPEELTYTITITDNDDVNPDVFLVDGVVEVGPDVSFTQAQVDAGLVQFVHGGSNTIATFTATVTDTFPAELGEPNTIDVPLIATLEAENDAPIVENNIILTLDEGEAKTLSADNLLTTDEETTAAEELVYTIDEAINGTFALLDVAQGTSTEIMVGETFTQADIDAGVIQFVHDGGEDAPTYALTVVDTPLEMGGEVTPVPITSNIVTFNNLNDAPIFDANTLTVTEGAEVTLTAENLAASDVDNLPAELRFSITAVEGGEFFLNGTPLELGQQFTAAAIAFEELTFKDDGDEEAATYTVKVEDNAGGETEAAAVVILDNVNDTPTLSTNTFTITEGDRLTLNDPDAGVTNLAATDPETPADELIFKVSEVNGGSFFDFNAQPVTEFTQEVLNRGEISFVHDGSETVPTFEITVIDGDAGEFTETANVAFVPVNDPPTIDTVQLTVTEGAAATLTPEDIVIVDTDTPPEGLTITISGLEGGTFNRLADGVVVDEGILTFTQAELIAGEVEFVDDGDQIEPSFSVTVNDGEFDSETVPVTILEFINTNDDPVAVPDSGTGFETDENTAFITASVVANDTDVDPDDVDNLVVSQIEGQDVSVGDIELASGAIVSLAGNGTINYDPNGKFQLPLGESTEDSFTYTVSDGNGGTDSTTVTVTINGVNDDPIAVDDEGEGFSTLDNESVTTPPLISNDEDPDGDNLRIIRINDATVNPGDTVPLDDQDTATATLNEDGSITYTPSDVFRLASVGDTLDDTFTYTITDDNGGESTATVNIVINGANEAPVVGDDLGFTTVEGTNLPLDVLGNDTDIDINDELTVNSVDTTGLLGSVVNNGDSLTYVTPLSLRGDETALETFTYTVTDGIAVSESATVQVLVTGVNDAPIAVADSGAGFTTNETTAFTTANVLANDSDPEGASLSLVGLDTSGTQGLITNNGDGTFNYDPNGAFNTLPVGQTDTDTFSYTVSDDLGLTTTTTVTIGVTGLLSEFSDFEQQLQLQDLNAAIPADAVGGLPLAQLYDESFYLAQNPDVAGLVSAGVLNSGYEHFVAFGINEGRNPSVLYNESFYLNQNPDIADAVANGSVSSGLSHFLTIGHIEGRDSSAFFDQSDYLLNNPDVALGVAQGNLLSGFQHYILLGADESRGPNLSLFDEQFYLSNNPDVVGIDAYEHFTLFGQFEGRQPSALYNEASYLALNSDIANAVNTGALANGFQHYEAFGRFEGREVFA